MTQNLVVITAFSAKIYPAPTKVDETCSHMQYVVPSEHSAPKLVAGCRSRTGVCAQVFPLDDTCHKIVAGSRAR